MPSASSTTIPSRAALTTVLAHAGATSVAVDSVAEAIATIARSAPDLVVSDIAMPGEDGYDLIRRLRALSPEQGGRVPALAITAHARSEDRARALEAGYQAFLAKPIEPGELLSTVAALTRDARNA